MELDQLRHFLKVAEFENFTRAASDVGLSQPALSRSIGRLEEELGQSLFERQRRKTALTDAGKLLLARAKQILLLVDDAKAEIGDDGERGRIRIGAIPTVAPYYLPERLWEFQQKQPLAQVVVQEDTTDHLLKKLADGEVDLAIAALPIEAKYLRVEPLLEEELLLVLPADHPLKEKKTVRLRDIESLPFVLLGEAHCLTDSVVAFCRRRSFHPLSVERTSQLTTVQELVSLGHGISLIPAMARRRDQSDRRVYRSLAGEKPTRTVVLVTNPYRFRSRLQKKLEDVLRGSRCLGPGDPPPGAPLD